MLFLLYQNDGLLVFLLLKKSGFILLILKKEIKTVYFYKQLAADTGFSVLHLFNLFMNFH